MLTSTPAKQKVLGRGRAGELASGGWIVLALFALTAQAGTLGIVDPAGVVSSSYDAQVYL